MKKSSILRSRNNALIIGTESDFRSLFFAHAGFSASMVISTFKTTEYHYTMPKFDFSLHHASLIVANTQASLLFYSGILGMQQMDRPDLGFPGAWLKVGDQQIHLLELDNPDPTTGRPEHGGRDRHVAMTVLELTPVKEALDAAGFAYTVSKSGRKALFCRDPDGNAIEIIDRAQFQPS